MVPSFAISAFHWHESPACWLVAGKLSHVHRQGMGGSYPKRTPLTSGVFIWHQPDSCAERLAWIFLFRPLHHVMDKGPRLPVPTISFGANNHFWR